ncbi:hypothetical protein N6N80_13145, partial [Escherichia albertii]|nr:hypothetical protein [Escherichia albertii]
LVLYNSKRPHKALALMTPVEYILRENKNCNMWWTHTNGVIPLFLVLTSVARVEGERLMSFICVPDCAPI